MPGLDPGIHDEVRHMQTLEFFGLRFIMDCRVKPGNDCGEAGA
jgi:hypothetical protein